MKRFLFAIGLVVTLAVAEAEAGYLVVRIVLEGGSGGGTDTPSIMGMAMSPMGPGPGMMIGPMGPGMGSFPRPGGLPGQFGAPPRPGVFGGPGLMGSAGGPPPMPTGSAGGPPPGMGSFAGPPRSGLGSAGGPPPMPGGTAMGPGMSQAGEGHHDPTRSIYVVIPYTNDITEKHPFYPKKTARRSENPTWEGLSVKHPFGFANLLFDNTQIQIYTDLGPQAPKGTRTRQTELRLKHQKWLKNPADGQGLLDLLADALETGYVTEAVQYADELLAAVQEKKARTTPQVDRFVQAYGKIKDPLRQAARLPSDGPAWKQRLGFAFPGVNDTSRGHYHLLYWDATDLERNRRLDQLEANFKAFFLLNAVRGVALPVPDRPLVVILAKSIPSVRQLAATLDGMPSVSDGFYAPEHNILVLSPERMDAVGQTFERQVQQMYREGASRELLLKGDGPPLDTGMTQQPVKDGRKPEEVARLMTWALAERYVQEESEWSAVSREGSRQLLYATGVLPKHVALPLWLGEGSANYYGRPKGPVFTTHPGDHKTHITVAIATGYGGPNYVRQKQFSELVRLKQLNTDPGQTLRNVVSDAYFAAIWHGLDADDPKLPLPEKKPIAAVGAAGPPAPAVPDDPATIKRKRAEFLMTKAYATSWALYYHLAKNDPAGLNRYTAELAQLPRDLPLDDQTRLSLFARSFNLTTDGKPTDGRQTFTQFGAAWLQATASIPPAGVDIQLADLGSPMNNNGTPGFPPGAPPGFGAPSPDSP